jgi:hypothetical protein
MLRRALFVLLVLISLHALTACNMLSDRDQTADAKLGLVHNDSYDGTADSLSDQHLKELEEQERRIQRQAAERDSPAEPILLS